MSPAAGFNMGLLLVSAAGLIVSLVMLRSHIFGKVTAYAGILANVVGLAYYIALAMPATGSILLALPACYSCYGSYWSEEGSASLAGMSRQSVRIPRFL
jgi:hypothetical protein